MTLKKETHDVEEILVKVNPMKIAFDDTKIVDTSDNPRRKSVIECIHPTKSKEIFKPLTHEPTTTQWSFCGGQESSDVNIPFQIKDVGNSFYVELVL